MNNNGRPDMGSLNSNGLYQIRDRVAEMAIGPVLTAKRHPAAIRQFHSALADGRTSLSQHPADYELLYVGEQDEDTGAIYGAEKPVIVATGEAWVESQPRTPETA